jgi:hypothetical protein
VLLWTAAVFAVIQLVGGLLLDYCWPHIRSPQAGALFARLDRLPRTPEIVCLGSSRFQLGIKESVLNPLLHHFTHSSPQVLNLAIGCGDAVVADWMLERMLRQGHRPALLVVEITPENLAARNKWLEYHVLRYLTWTDLPRCFLDTCRYTHPMRFLGSRLLPLHFHRYQLRKQIREAALALLPEERASEAAPGEQAGSAPEENEGGLPAVPSLPADDLTDRPALAVQDVADWLWNYRLGGTAPRALERLLDRCRDEGIAVLLAAPPLSRPHRMLYSPAIEGAFQAYLQALSKKYGCRFVDYRARVPDQCFTDHHHMNAVGGAYFSRLLAREVLIPEWRELHR